MNMLGLWERIEVWIRPNLEYVGGRGVLTILCTDHQKSIKAQLDDISEKELQLKQRMQGPKNPPS